MWRKLRVIAFLLIACAVLWVYTSTEFIIWDGGFKLTVRVSGTAGPPRSVFCEAFGHREDAEFAVRRLVPPEKGWWPDRADPFDGEPLQVKVPLSGRQSMSGRELARMQFRYLAVVGQLSDGRWVGKVVDIPDCRESREVSVELP